MTNAVDLTQFESHLILFKSGDVMSVHVGQSGDDDFNVALTGFLADFLPQAATSHRGEFTWNSSNQQLAQTKDLRLHDLRSP